MVQHRGLRAALELTRPDHQSIRFGIYQSVGTHALDILRLVTNTAGFIVAQLGRLFLMHNSGDTHAQRVALVIGNADYRARTGACEGRYTGSDGHEPAYIIG